MAPLSPLVKNGSSGQIAANHCWKSSVLSLYPCLSFSVLKSDSNPAELVAVGYF